MSLSARIALEPSRRIASLERSMAAGGLAVATAFAIGRWPAAAGAIAASAAVAVAVLATLDARRRRDGPLTLAVSDTDEIGVAATDGRIPADGWRLAEGTLAWPSFAVVRLRHDDGAAPLVVPVPMAGLPPRERWALARFLGWSLRRRSAADERRER